VTFSFKKKAPIKVAKSGDTEEIGTAREASMYDRLRASRTQPKPNAMIPPEARIIHVFLFSFMKWKCLSMNGESAKNNKVVANILTVFTTKAESIIVIRESSNAWSIKIMLTDQTTAAAKEIETPLNKTLLVTSTDPAPS